MKTIYFDMDGTIADYKKRFVEIFGADMYKKFGKMTKEQKFPFKKKMSEQNFYEELDILPMFNRMYTLWKNGHNVAILTSVGRVNPYAVAQQKLKWLENVCPGDFYNHLSKNFYFVCKSADKALFANEDTCLVDDREKAWRPFLEAGGSVVIV